MYEDVKMKPIITLYVNLRNWEGKFGKNQHFCLIHLKVFISVDSTAAATKMI